MIGIFDSGVGGLTVLKAMRAVYPSIDAVYFGDTKNAPYGQKSGEELSRYTVSGLRFLLDHGASALVSACNSVSASLVLSLHDVLSLGDVPLIEMVGPTVSAFKGSDARVALVATVATVESKMYQNAFRMIGKDITAIAIPELAGAIERGDGEAAYERAIAEALAELPADSYDMLVLGCTHYPLVIDIFRRLALGKAIFDPAEAVAERVYGTLWPREMGYGKTSFFISRDSAQFRTFAAELFPKGSYTISVVE